MLWVQILHEIVEALVHCYFGLSLTRRYILGHLGYYYCSCSLDLGLGRFSPHFFKEAVPLALGPPFRPSVEFWVQLSYPQRFSSRSNQSRCDTWRDTKNHPSQLFCNKRPIIVVNAIILLCYGIICNWWFLYFWWRD